MIKAHPAAWGTVAIALTTATLILLISFVAVLTTTGSTFPMGMLALTASFLCALGLVFLILLQYEHVLDRNHSQKAPRAQRRWRVLQQITCLSCVLADFVTIATLIWMHSRGDLPVTTLGGPTKKVVVAAFVFWVGSCLAQGIFLAVRSNGGNEQAQLPGTDADRDISEMQENSQIEAPLPRSRGEVSFESPASTISSRKRSGSDTVNSVRSSFSQFARPNSSKTRLVPNKILIQAPSTDSGTGEREIMEDGFDSWDTSAIDQQSWQTAMTSSHPSPTQGRVLETIPASPTTSRSPSPGYPMDLRPPQIRRSRSHSPANSYRESSRRVKPASPAGDEAHIHPLFRTDSPSPAPSASPTTTITAAPDAGKVISDRRSVRRMRSGSLPTTALASSPLVHSNSSDDAEQASRKSSGSSSGRLSPPEREMTPPIPDWVLGAGTRTSWTGYAKRKEGTGLGVLGEER